MASSSELRRPVEAIRVRSASQRSAHSGAAVGKWSMCSSPRAARVSSYASCRPSCSARSAERS